MELKPQFVDQAESLDSTFNRTTMELKRLGALEALPPRSPFNRTTMELKHRNNWSATLSIAAFNRTTMELKPLEKGCYNPVACDF